MLRAATLPGARTVVAILSHLPEVQIRILLRVLARFPGVISSQDVEPLVEGITGLAGATQRRAFVRTAHAVIDWKGQTVSASRQLRLLADLPVLVAWGTDDRTIPPYHHQTIVRQLPDSCTAGISGAGHYPHETAPQRLLPAVHAFLDSTTPFRYDEARWRDLLIQDGAEGPPATSTCAGPAVAAGPEEGGRRAARPYRTV